MLKRLLPLMAVTMIFAMNSRAQSVSWNDRILLPVGVVEERLDNGLSYILVENDSPDRMVEMRLIFRAGSVLEDENCRGAAHFLEHMAFGGTKHFPGRKLVDYLESLGVQYGMGINAYTGYDRTVYQLAVPSDEPEYIGNALLIMKDWLVDMALDEEKVENEKGIIIEELRGYDVGDEFYNLKIGSGLYSRGIPLGTEEDIRKMTPEILRDFHDRWYTLSQATVVLVGDFDKDEVRECIVRTFGKLPPTSSEDYREHPHTYDAGVNYAEVKDTLVRRSILEIMIPHECTSRRTVGDAVDDERNKMLLSALSRRFYDCGIDASLSNTWYLADKDHFTISVEGKDSEVIAGGMRDAVAELYRVARHGFTPEEMDIVRKRELERFRIPHERSSSSYICESIASDVMFGDRDITDPKQFEWAKEQLASTLSADLQKILTRWLFAAENCKLASFRYNPRNTSGFTPDELESLWQSAEQLKTGPYVFVPAPPEPEQETVEIPAFLLEEKEYDPSCVLSRTDYPNTGITDVSLSNGFRLVLRPTNDEEHKVQMQIFSPGGLSRVPEQDYPLYEGTAGYMELGGIESVSDDEYFSILSGNDMGLVIALEGWWHGLIASAPSSRSSLMFNIAYEKMHHPRLDHEEFEELRKDNMEYFGEESYLSKLMKSDWQRQISMKTDSLMGNLMYGRRTTLTRQDIEDLDLDRIGDFYKSIYTDPRGMVCVLCGDFDTDELIRQAASVFGRMKAPSEGPVSAGKSHFSLPDGSHVYEWPCAVQSQTSFDYLVYGKYEPSLRGGLILKLMQNLIRNRLLTILREEESIVYSPYISLFYNAVPDGVFYFDINAAVDTRNTALVHRLLDGIIRDLQANKVQKKELDTLKRIFIVNKRNYLQHDATSSWKTYLVGQLRNGESVADLENYEKILEDITPEDIRTAFRTLVDGDRHIIMSMGEFVL